MSNKKTCFVVMGFGKKVDFETGKEFDLDMTYKNVMNCRSDVGRFTSCPMS
jgi:hypothetical protein